MALPIKPLPARPDLTELLRKAKEWEQNATPEQKGAMRRAQRRSWVIGEMGIERPEIPREQIEQWLDESGY